MPFLAFFVLMAQSPLTQGPAMVSADVALLHRRPSKIVRVLSDLSGGKVFLLPDDEQSMLRLIGAKKDVEAMKSSIRLFDVEARKARLELRVESPLDHTDWKGTIEVRNNEPWSGEDGGTGVRLRLSPRLNEDGTCTLMIEADAGGDGKVQTVFRLKKNEEQTLTLPSMTYRPNGKVGTPAKVHLRLLNG